MTAYKNEWNGHARKVVERACRQCEYRESKESGIWNSDLKFYELQDLLKEVCGDPPSILITKNGPKGEITARVPIDMVELHRYISRVQAKQKMETCIACEAIGRRIASGDIPVVEDFEIK